MKRWVECRKSGDFDAIAQRFGISKFLARIIRNRDIIGDDAINVFINGTLKDMHSPSLLKDIDKAADGVADAIRKGEKIRIIGDYDIDGVCSSYILKKSLRLMGADVDAVLPDRVKDGYGLNISLVDDAKRDGVSLIVTCDNGISAREEIAHANQLGMKVVVTDHHEPPYEVVGVIGNATKNDNETIAEETVAEVGKCGLHNINKNYFIPDALAVVDPKRPDCSYPFENICGGMVAYKLIQYMLENERYKDLVKSFTQDDIDEIVVFAAFATVGDLMTINDENRIIVRYGLKKMATCNNPGLRALIDVSGIDKNSVSVYHIGFVLGPCMNATGRLDTAMRALELLECNDYDQAVTIARELKEINESRKNMTNMYAEMAIDSAKDCDDKVLVLFLPDCHESLAGIVAGRVKEKYYKPTIILTKGSEGAKGSGRSIEDYNLFEELSKVSDIFTKFGGHKLAAGMSLPLEKIDELRRRLNENVTLTDEQLIEKCVIDIVLDPKYLSVEFVEEFDKLAPYGIGNPKPLFAARNIPFENLQIMGKNRNVLKMTFLGQNERSQIIKTEGIMFGNPEDIEKAYNDLTGLNTLTILYQADINEYNGRKKVQAVIRDYKI